MSWQYFTGIFPALINGTKMTLSIFGLTLLLALPLGLLVSVGLRSRFKPLRALLDFYVWVMRGTPLLLQLIFVFYGLPLIHIVLERYSAALFAFVLNYAAYFAEIFRGGLQSVDQGQIEAAQMLKLKPQQIFMHIILPQVNKKVIPAIGNEVINLVKDSSLVYVIGLGDLLRAGNIAMARDVTLLPLLAVAAIYLLLTAVLTWLLRRAERHYAYYE
ncbi:amino acid ABC transporter permease [Lapidilactobacillus wuchangensis]|uniref:amino acid ABC transporter permease n=1 Tax=Lapidilactobacillus wuchangensis TaxID=2486001 RepID=UPI000F76D690|nr:amino acid ABC transporter permease [Lapidilactobacillus wuchangensis]